jgi:hypothetical protein
MFEAASKSFKNKNIKFVFENASSLIVCSGGRRKIHIGGSGVWPQFRITNAKSLLSPSNRFWETKALIIGSRRFYTRKKSKMKQVLAVAAMAVLIAAGAIGIYFYTSAPPYTSTPISSSTTSSIITFSQTTTPPGGWIDSKGQPQGAWAAYLGYIPAGYTLAPHYLGASTYPCPSGMSPDQCTQFKASCGNGVCDPNESCSTCPIDCSVAGQLTCDPYTGRAGSPISICQMPGRV